MKKLARKAMREILSKQAVEKFSPVPSSHSFEGKEKEVSGGSALRKANNRAV